MATNRNNNSISETQHNVLSMVGQMEQAHNRDRNFRRIWLLAGTIPILLGALNGNPEFTFQDGFFVSLAYFLGWGIRSDAARLEFTHEMDKLRALRLAKKAQLNEKIFPQFFKQGMLHEYRMFGIALRQHTIDYDDLL